MGLRTINGTLTDHDNFKGYLLRRRRRAHLKNLSKIIDLGKVKNTNNLISNDDDIVISLHPNELFSNKMAPALTEPLSPANKLSSSAASASPRPSSNPPSSLDNNIISTTSTTITTTSTTPLTTSTLTPTNDNGENCNELMAAVVDGGTESSSLRNNNTILSSVSSGILTLTDDHSISSPPTTNKEINNLTETKSSSSSTSSSSSSVVAGVQSSTQAKGAFQLAFEQSVAKKAAAAAAATTTPTTATATGAGGAAATSTALKKLATIATKITKASQSPTINEIDQVKNVDQLVSSMRDISSATVVAVDSLMKTQNISKTTIFNHKTAAAVDIQNKSTVIGFASDFEEEITAEICVRNPKTDTATAINKSTAAAATAVAVKAVAETADQLQKNVIVKINSTESLASSIIVEDTAKDLSQHMDFSDELDANTTISRITAEPQQSEIVRANELAATTTSTDTTTATSTADMTVTNALTLAESKLTDADGTKVQNSKESPSSFRVVCNDSPSATITSTTSSNTQPAASIATRLIHDESNSPNRATILSVQELPPIKTDSTATVSEDDIEERLSQLDGGDIVTILPNSQESGGGCVTIISGMELITATPPRPSTNHHQLQLQLQQNVQTPPTATVISIPASSLTPQSTTSSSTIGGNLQKDFMKDSGEMDQELEEVLKALKGFDATSSGDGLCDFGALFNDIYTTVNYEEVNPPATTKSNPLKEIQTEIAKKQHTMQRKIDFQIRRLRKLQARYMSKHTSEEISGLFEWSARIANKRKNTDDDISERQQLSYAEEKYHPVSTTTMLSVVKKIESVANTQQVSLSAANIIGVPSKKAKNQKTSQLIGGGSTDIVVQPTAVTVVPTYDDKVTEEIAHVSGLLHTEMREVQNALDSDATASSSGGESADEMVTYNNQIQQSLSIAKRAAWRYSRDRAAIAARWSWLLSQIAGLEIKIRNHSEVYQNMVKHKGPVISDYELEMGTNATIASGGGGGGAAAAAAVAATIGGATSVNGYRGALPSSVSGEMKTSDHSASTTITEIAASAATAIAATTADDKINSSTELPGSCRTRGYVASHFVKRKLFQTTNIHTISKKAARPSTLKCGCQWPLHPCALCTGRSDPTAPRDLPDTMTMSEKVALLDPGFHPVLSFPEDIASSIYFEAIARQSDWQNRVMRCTAKSVIKGAIAAQKAAEREHRAATFSSGSMLNSSNTGQSKKYYESGMKRKYTKKNRDNSITGGGAMGAVVTTSATTSTTPLVANKLGKYPKKYQKSTHRHHANDDAGQLFPAHHHQNRYEMNDYLGSSHHHHQNNNNTNQQLRNSDLYNHHQAHSSSSYHHHNHYQHQQSTKNKTRKLSSAIYHQSHHQYHSANGSGGSCSSSTYSNTNSDLNFLHCDSLDGISNSGFPSRSRTSSPTHGGSSSIYKHERFLERKNRSSYDIDNIVIPYSIAASTRVEILPYKEIPTPKWRLINDDEEFLNPLASMCDDHLDLGSPMTMDIDIHKSIIETKDEENVNNDQQPASGLSQCLSPPTTDGNSFFKSIENDNDENDDGDGDVVMRNLSDNSIAAEKSKLEKSRPSDNFVVHKEKIANCEKEVENRNAISDTKKSSNIFDSIATTEEECDDEKGEIPLIKVTKSNGDSDVEKTELLAAGNSVIDTNEICEDKSSSEIDNDTTTNSSAGVIVAVMKSMHKNANDSTSNAVVVNYFNDNDDDLDDMEEEEDISEEAMILRHERALTEERRKFQTYLKFPWSTRSRANRRIDSRAESSGANTPDPTSPAPVTNPSKSGTGDQESIPSPAATSANPINLLDPITESGESSSVLNSSILSSTPAAPPPPPITNYNCVNNKRSERRRTVSAKKDKDYNDHQRRSSTPDLRETIPPYEPLYFPIPDELFDSMLKMMPDDHQHYSFTEDCQTAKIQMKKPKNLNNCEGRKITKLNSSSLVVNKNCDANNKMNRINDDIDKTDIVGVTSSSNCSGSGSGINSTCKRLKTEAVTTITTTGGGGNGSHCNTKNDSGGGGGSGGDQLTIFNTDAGLNHMKNAFQQHRQHQQQHQQRPHPDDDEFAAFTCRNNLLGESDCETTDSGQLDDDPNDPEWRDEPE